MGLSPLGIFHTVIGVIALISAATDYLRFGKINLSKAGGKIYFYFTLITSLTALGLSKNGGFNPGGTNPPHRDDNKAPLPLPDYCPDAKN